MAQDLRQSVVRILDKNSNTVGTGFVIDANSVVTCAHVVEVAGAGPDEVVTIAFALTGDTYAAEIVADAWRPTDGEDIAILRLQRELPVGVTPVTLGLSRDTAGHTFRVFGYPQAGNMQGIWAKGDILGTVTSRGITILQSRSHEITEGISGAPVLDTESDRVVGMITTISDATEGSGGIREATFVTPIEVIVNVWPSLELVPPRQFLSIDQGVIYSEGGTYVEGLVDISGNDFIARDMHIHYLYHRPMLGKPFQAPPLPPHFVSRPEVIEPLKAHLLANRPATPGILVINAIHGLGGIGKSTLAAALAYDLDVQQRFKDGILWATLGQQPDLLSLLSGWVQALGDFDFRPTTVEGATNHLRTLLQDEATLLVVDDVWDPDQAKPFRVAGPQGQMLITTRRADVADEIGAALHQMDVMTPEQSLTLLTARLGRPIAENELAEVLALARDVGYLPLALELVAARVVRGTSWTVLRQALETEFVRLEALESPSRRRMRPRLEASFNLSLNTLRNENEGAWQAFVWLGILPEDARIATPMAATLWGMSETEAVETLELLWNNALLLPTPPVLVNERQWPAFRLHELLHDIARRWLTAAQPQGLGVDFPKAHVILLERYHQNTQNNLWHTLPDDGYIYPFLTWHMEQSEQTEQIHNLLQEETNNGQNGWYKACEQHGQIDTFLADLNRAWRLADEKALVTCASSSGREESREWGLTIRYALTNAFLKSLVSNHMPELSVATVEEGMWLQIPGLTFALRMPDKEQQVKVLVNLIPYLPEYFQEGAIRKILTMIQEIRREAYLSDILVQLAPYLSQRVLVETLSIARTMEDERFRAKVLTELTPYLPEVMRADTIKEALATARSIRDDYGRVEALTNLALRQGELGYIQESLDTAQSVWNKNDRAKTLIRLLPYLSQPLKEQILREVLITLQEITSGYQQVEVTANLILQMAELGYGQEALAVTQSIWDENDRANILIKLVPYLSGSEQTRTLRAALAAVQAKENETDRARALTELASHLPEVERTEVLREALVAAQVIENKVDWVEAVIRLAYYLPEAEQAQILEEALATARVIGSDYRRGEILVELASKLPEPLTKDALQEALNAALSIEDYYQRVAVLKGLVTELVKLNRPALCLIWREILFRLSQAQYREFLSNLSILTPIIAHLGGTTAVKQVFRTIENIDYWWREEPIQQESIAQWTKAQIRLAIAPSEYTSSDWAENIERAINYYQQMLRVLIQQESLVEAAVVRVNLASAYRVRIRGSRTENIERAIEFYQQAMQVYTRQKFPEQWAAIEVNLATAYYYRAVGNRVENLRQAEIHFQRSLEICDREDFSEQYSTILHHLEMTQQELSRIQFFMLWDNMEVEDIDHRVRQFCDFLCHLMDLTLQSYHAFHNRGLYLGVFDLRSLFQDLPLPATDKFPILFLAVDSLNEDLLVYIRQTLHKNLGLNNQQALLIPFFKDQAMFEAKGLLAGAVKKAHAFNIIYLSREEIEQIIVDIRPCNVLRHIILSQLDLTRISVYKPAGTTPDKMFFGRERELLEICTHIALANYVLIGGRRIGKTSILKRLERVRLPASGFRPFYHECGYTRTQAELVQALISNKAWFSKAPPPKLSSLAQVVQALPDDKPLVILFDEADQLIKLDQQAGYPIFNTLRALSNANRCSFVLCGERALRAELTNPNSPLYNFAKDMLIGRLERHAVEELVTQPIKQLDIKLTDETAIVQHIWDFTSGHPSIVQSLCYQLIVRLNQRGERHLTLGDVEAVVADPDFLRKEFLNVYWERATVLERLCSLVIATNDSVNTLMTMHQALTSRGIEVSLNQVDDALERLVDLRNILQRTVSGYQFAVTAFPQVIAKTQRLDDLIALNCEIYQQKGDIEPHTKGGV